MKPIFILAIAAIAATGIGAAQLNNDINVTAGGFGTGGTDIASPIDNADVNFTIAAIVDEDTQTIKNVITECNFHGDEDLDEGAIVYCKLSSDAAGASDTPTIVAEGHVTLEEGYKSSTYETIPIDVLAYNGSNSVFNIHDVHLVVIGENATNPDPIVVLP